MIIGIAVKDVATRLLSYDQIKLERATSPTGVFSVITTIALVSGTYDYSYTDSSGVATSYYRYRFFNSNTSATSGYSDVFRADGVTRLAIRQQALSDYKAGLVLNADASGQTTSVAAFTDYRVKSSVWQTGRGQGGWLYPTGGVNALSATHILNTSDPSNGLFNISPAWASALTVGDEVEWHWLADPDVWNTAINRAMNRYSFLERQPFVGTSSGSTSNPELSLAGLPGLVNKSQVCGVWYYPVSGEGEHPWNEGGQWYHFRQESGYLTLQTYPSLQTTDTVYIEYLRPYPQLYTDTDVLPADTNVELAAALAYDEVLADICRPEGGATVDVAIYLAERGRHNIGRLRQLWKVRGPKYRYQVPTPPFIPMTPSPYSSR